MTTKSAFFTYYSRPYNEIISFNLLASVSKLSKLKELGILHFQFPNCVTSTNISYTMNHYHNQIHRYHISFLDNLNFFTFFFKTKFPIECMVFFPTLHRLRWYKVKESKDEGFCGLLISSGTTESTSVHSWATEVNCKSYKF